MSETVNVSSPVPVVENVHPGNRTTEECLRSARENYDRDTAWAIKYHREQYEANVTAINAHFAILPALLAIVGGNGARIGGLYSMRSLDINLGEQPTRRRSDRAAFAAKLVALKRLLGNFSLTWKEAEDVKKQTARVTFSVADYPGIKVNYVVSIRKKRGGKAPRCKIVKVTSHRLVCEA